MKQVRKLFWVILGVMLICMQPVTQAAPKENFTKVVLKNGLTVMYKVMKDQPQVAMYAMFPVGMNKEKEKGIAHLVEHLVFRGGSGYQFKDIADSTIRQGGSFNGFTSIYNTAYYYIVPKEGFTKAFKVFNGSIWKTNFSEDVVALERKIVVHELDMDYSERLPAYPIYRYFFPEINYTKETVGAITVQDLINFHKNYYQPENATYVLAGDFDPKSVLAELEGITNGYGQQKVDKTDIKEFLLPRGEISETRNLYPYQFQLVMGYEFTGLSQQEKMVLKLLNYIYGFHFKIDYTRNEYKIYDTITRSVGTKDYFGLYYLERNQPYSDEAYAREKANMLKFFREYKKVNFNKDLKNFIKQIEQEIVSSQESPQDAAEYELQRLNDPDSITQDSLPVLKKLTIKDLERFIDTNFSKPPTTWILVKTDQTGGNLR